MYQYATFQLLVVLCYEFNFIFLDGHARTIQIFEPNFIRCDILTVL